MGVDGGGGGGGMGAGGGGGTGTVTEGKHSDVFLGLMFSIEFSLE